MDGRQYIGMLVSVDTTGSLYLQDALEFVDINAKTSFQHDMFSPQIMNLPVPKDKLDSLYPGEDDKPVWMPHYLGNYAVTRESVKRILLDKRAQSFFDSMAEKHKENKL